MACQKRGGLSRCREARSRTHRVVRRSPNGRVGAQNRPADYGERFFKKSLGAFQGSSSSSRHQWRGCVFNEIRQAAAEGQGEAVKALCAMTGLSRATYYRWRRPPTASAVAVELRDEMQRIALEFPSYGYRRITAELQRRNWKVNHKRVLRMMREDNLLCLRRKSFLVTTDSRHPLPVYPNVARNMTPEAVNQLWVADIRISGCGPSLFTWR